MHSQRLLLWLAALIILGCASSTREVARKPVTITAREISVTEMGVADRTLPENQQRYLSRQAAIVQAERSIRRAIEAFIESEVTTDRGMVQSDRVKERVSGVIRGAEIIKAEWSNPATCEVTMRITKEKMQELSDWMAALR